MTVSGHAPVDVAAEAYVWGYPLVAMHRTRAAHGPRAHGALVGRSSLATAADRTVVAPNDDTLYASGWFDLRRGDVTVTVAVLDPPDRYWSVMLLDAWTDMAYVCRRLHGTGGARVRVTRDPVRRPAVDRPLDVVPIGTRTVWVLARVLVDEPADLPAARAALAAIDVRQEPPSRAAAEPAPGVVAADPAGRGFFAELAAALAVDPPAPWHPPAPPGVERLLADPPPAAVLAEGARRGKERIAALGGGPDRHGNGWGTRLRGADFGGDVAYRAAFARVSLAGHLPAENRSYSRVVDGSRRAVLRFPPGGEPPVGAFWSLSLYGPDMFFVDNELGRHSVGDRTPGLERDAEGSLAVTIGHERPDRTANWLPAPAGPCVLALRAYEGAPAVVDATWFPPDLGPAP